jgi:hypothetical protein
MQDAVVSGKVVISEVFVSPQGKTFVVLPPGTNLDDTSKLPGQEGDLSKACMFAEIDRQTGVPVCVERGAGFQLNNKLRGAGFKNFNLQFDSSGAAYYLVQVGDLGERNWALRRYFDGAISDLLTFNGSPLDYAVSPSGIVLVSTIQGDYASGGPTSKLVRYEPGVGADEVADLPAGGGSFAPTFMRFFPDGNLYIGHRNGYSDGVQRYLSASRNLEAKYWMNEQVCGPINPCSHEAPYFTVPGGGWDVESLATLQDGRVYGSVRPVYGSVGSGSKLLQYFPTVKENVPTTLISHASMEPAGNDLVIAGQDASGRNVLVLHSGSTDEEASLVAPDFNVQITGLSYTASLNKMTFAGQRVTDGQYVVGIVDLAARTAQVTATFSFPVSQFAGFR